MRIPDSTENRSAQFVLIATSLSFFLIILDTTVVNVALGQIQVSLGASVTGLQWVLNAYTLVFASSLLTAGALCDRQGAKYVFVAGLISFCGASLACGMAADVSILVAARILQGVGAALSVPSSLALLTASFPESSSRARAVGVWAGTGGLALGAGPIVGGVFVDRFGWPSIFLLNLPVGLTGVWLALSHAPTTRRFENRRLDLAGQMIAFLSLGSLSGAFVEAGSLGWMHPLVITGFIVFAITSASFLFVESRSEHPMLPLSLFRVASISTSCLVGLLTNFAYYGLLFVLSLYFQLVKGYSPLKTGLAFLPMTAVVTVANVVAGRMTARFGPKFPMAAGQALAATGYIVLAFAGVQTPYAMIIGPLLAAGIGVALTVPAMTAAVLADIEMQRAGIASAALNAARQTGGVVGVGVFGSLLVGGTGRLIVGMHSALIAAGVALAIGSLVSVIGLHVPKGKLPRKSDF